MTVHNPENYHYHNHNRHNNNNNNGNNDDGDNINDNNSRKKNNNNNNKNKTANEINMGGASLRPLRSWKRTPSISATDASKHQSPKG